MIPISSILVLTVVLETRVLVLVLDRLSTGTCTGTGLVEY